MNRSPTAIHFKFQYISRDLAHATTHQFAAPKAIKSSLQAPPLYVYIHSLLSIISVSRDIRTRILLMAVHYSTAALDNLGTRRWAAAEAAKQPGRDRRPLRFIISRKPLSSSNYALAEILMDLGIIPPYIRQISRERERENYEKMCIAFSR